MIGARSYLCRGDAMPERVDGPTDEERDDFAKNLAALGFVPGGCSWEELERLLGDETPVQAA